jgi:sugar lactone lactonase YvrE
VLYVLREERGPRLRAFDWDGRPLGEGFAIPAADSSTCDPRGLAVDGDRRLWIADRGARALRAFSVFGVEVRRLSGPAGRLDTRGGFEQLSALAAQGVEDELLLAAGSTGERRHALALLGPQGRLLSSLRPLGDPEGRFRGLTDLALRGRTLHACEEHAGRIQVFRDGEFHYALRAGGLRPCAIAPLADGRVIVAQAGERSALVVLESDGSIERSLASHGEGEGAVCDSCSLAVEEGEDERHTRIALLDRGGDRVQVFALDGRCFGCFPDLSCATF